MAQASPSLKHTLAHTLRPFARRLLPLFWPLLCADAAALLLVRLLEIAGKSAFHDGVNTTPAWVAFFAVAVALAGLFLVFCLFFFGWLYNEPPSKPTS